VDISFDPSANLKLYVATSRLQDAGNGAFSLDTIHDGDSICDYTGNTNLTLHQVRRRAYTSQYVWTDDASGYVCDAADAQSCAARYVNDALDEHRNNAKFVLQGTRLFLRATRTILPHEEICAAYGGEYWQQPHFSASLLTRAMTCYHQPDFQPSFQLLLDEAIIEELFSSNPSLRQSGSDASVHQLFDQSLPCPLQYKWSRQ
jgi:hypothetical protein